MGVAKSTVYGRVRKLKSRRAIKKIAPLLNSKKCGLSVTAWIRISIHSIQDIGRICKELAMIDEVVEVHEISGKWDIFTKIKVKNNEELRDIQVNKIGNIQGISGLYPIIAIRTEKEDIKFKIKKL